MRAYLSSFRLGNQPRRLVELLHDNKRAVVVLNACDLLSDEERWTRVQQELAALLLRAMKASGFDGVIRDLSMTPLCTGAWRVLPGAGAIVASR
jgi:hypothetical protein